jgi:hypothetical protein
VLVIEIGNGSQLDVATALSRPFKVTELIGDNRAKPEFDGHMGFVSEYACKLNPLRKQNATVFDFF